MLARLLGAFLALLLPLAPASAQSPRQDLGTTFVDLGAGPLTVQLLSSSAARVCAETSVPAAGSTCGFVMSLERLPALFSIGTSAVRIYARALDQQAAVVAAPAASGASATGSQEQDVSETRTLSAALNTAQTYTLNGQGTFAFNFSGLATSGATVSFLASTDWNGSTGTFQAVSEVNTGTGQASTTRSTDGASAVGIEGAKAVRVQVTTGGTGTITLATNISVRSRYQAPRSPTAVSTTSVGGGINGFARLTSSTASTNATLVKATFGRVYKIAACNTSTTAARIKFHDVGTAPVPGTTAVKFSRPLPAAPSGGALACAMFDAGDIGWTFATGIAFSLTAGAADTDATAVAAGAITDVSVEYQ